MLENAVQAIDELRAVKVQADQIKVQNGKQLTFDEYLALVQSAAANYDAQYDRKRAPGHPNRRDVYAHDISEDDEEVFYGIDSSVSDVVSAYTLDRTTTGSGRPPSQGGRPPDGSMPRFTRMPAAKWFSLSPADQATWDTLTEETKAIVLGPNPSKPRSGHPPLRRRVNLHDLSAYEFLVEAHAHEQADQTLQAQLHERNAEPSIPDLPPEVSFDTLLAYATKGSAASPGDVRNMLSKPSTLKSSLKPSSHSAPPTATPPSKEVVLDGTTYRSISYADIYSVSQHASGKNGSLVDRGANGGIAGDDVRIIDRTHRSVDVRGIDNHQLTNIPIVTAGGVATSQHGDVIVILNQYAYTGKGRTIHSCAQMEWYKSDVNDPRRRSTTYPNSRWIRSPTQHRPRPRIRWPSPLYRCRVGHTPTCHVDLG